MRDRRIPPPSPRMVVAILCLLAVPFVAESIDIFVETTYWEAPVMVLGLVSLLVALVLTYQQLAALRQPIEQLGLAMHQVRETGGPLVLPAELPIFFRAFGDDLQATVEALREARSELQQKSERLQFLLANGPAVLYVRDARPPYGATFVSENIGRQTGWEPADFTRDPAFWTEHIHPDDRERVRAEVSALRADGRASSEYRFRAANGGYRWVYDEAVVIRDLTGGPVEMLGFWVDLTDRRRADEQLRQAQKMEAVGLLAGGVAHDFNNLLTTISGYTELSLLDRRAAAAGVGGSDVLVGRADLLEIRKAAERAAGLTRQLLAFSRRQVLHERVIAPGTVVAELAPMLRRLIREDVELRVDTAHACGSVVADPVQLQQVILNLAINARDAMPNGGTLVIEVEDVAIDDGELADVPAGCYEMIAVRDSGSGIAPDVLQHIFEPFFTTKPEGVGTGLGLATVYGIVRQSGGCLRVETAVGKGTCFRVYLPRVSATEPMPEQRPVVQPVARGWQTVLVVEDEASLRALVSTVLCDAGYKVLTAANGDEALAIARAHDGPIHLLLTDVVMPGLGGPALSRQLGALHTPLPTLYVSGYPTQEALDGVGDAHAHFLAKPFTPLQLLEHVRGALGAAAMLAPSRG
jgi:PAS domain S-box-containing protein